MTTAVKFLSTLCVVLGVTTVSTLATGGSAAANHAPLNVIETSVTYVPERCLLDAATGQCRASMRKFYFNIKSGQCEPFVYGGCGGNVNRFDTLSECHQTCTCKTPPETGPCRGHFRRWFYSPADGCCRPFVYGGCGGNSNNYGSWSECSNLCGYPTASSKWWEWGADWSKWNAQINETTSSSTQANASRTYSREDFMRDWILWGLLTGGEGELEMETIATLIAQAHMLGFGQATGSTGSFGSSRSSGSNVQNRAHSMADTQAALGYFQQVFGGGESESGLGAVFGLGVQNIGPAYSIPKSGSFTPLGGMGSLNNMMGFGPGMLDTNGRDSNIGMNLMGVGQFDQNVRRNQGQASAGTRGIKASAGAANWHESTGKIRSQNLGNTRQGWAPHGERVLPFGLGSGQFGALPTGGKFEQGGAAFEILNMIGQLGMGNLISSDLLGLARRFGATQPNGNVNMEVLAQRLVDTIRGPAGEAQMKQLRGIAQALGALDSSGNIDVKILMKNMASTFGRGGRGFGRGAGMGMGTGVGVQGMTGGLMFGQGTSGSVQSAGGVAVGGRSRRKTYGKK